MTEEKKNHWTLILAALCWVIGWAGAVAYGHGFEFPRMVVAIPGIVLAGIILLPGLARRGGIWMPGLLLVVVTGAYFAVRALYSPVWDLAKMDLLLVCLGCVSLVVGMRVADSSRAIWVLLGGLVVLFAMNAGVAIVQATSDPTYAFLRMPRVDQQGVSGLFWHRNYLAGMLELMVPAFLAVALVGGRNLVRIGFGILMIAGLVLAYYSQSRAGLLSVGVGCAVVFFVWLLRGWHGWSKNARVGMGLAGLVAVAVLAVGTLSLVSKVSVQRGKGESLEKAIATTDPRLAFAGLAYDQWQESPLLGTGSRTFSYHAVRNWDRESTWNGMGNPEMAHNDYLQTLAEYGVVGLVLIVGVAGLALARGVNQVWSKGREDKSIVTVVRLGALGGICGALVHSGVDFSLHILPNTLLLGLLMGFLLRSGTPSRSEAGERGMVAEEGPEGTVGRGSPSATGAGILGAVLVALVVAGSFVAGGRELLVLPAWFRFEQGVIASGLTERRMDELKEITDKAPDYELARYYGRITLGELLQKPEDRETLVPEALWAMKMAVDRHPFDGESRLNHAKVLDASGDTEGATREYLRAIGETWRRENKYGGMKAFSDHLARRGEKYWLARKPGKALGVYRRAMGYLERSWKLGYRPGGRSAYQKQKKFLRGRIDFLEGAGIKEESLEGEIPAPPKE